MTSETLTNEEACELLNRGIRRIELDDVLTLFVLADATDDYVHMAILDDSGQWYEHTDGNP